MSLSIYQLKPQFQRLLHPLVSLLAAARVTPNQMTVATAALMVGYGVALALWPAARGLWLGLVAVMPLRMALNALDGLLAHHTGRKTALGAMLNELCDVVSDLALYLPVALLAGVAAPLAILCAVGAAVVEFAGLSALAAGSPRRFDGPMGKSLRPGRPARGVRRRAGLDRRDAGAGGCAAGLDAAQSAACGRRATETVKMPSSPMRLETLRNPAQATRPSSSPWGRGRISQAAPRWLRSVPAIKASCGCQGWPV